MLLTICFAIVQHFRPSETSAARCHLEQGIRKQNRQQGYSMHKKANMSRTQHFFKCSSNIAQTPSRGHDISGDWWPQAELVDRSLPAYTPAPSNPSFMGAFVPVNGNGCLFSGEASSLDAFSSYPQRRGCPATALSDNRLTRGHSVPFLSY